MKISYRTHPLRAILLASLLVISASPALSSTASAQANGSRDEQARLLFQAGDRAFADGDYESALDDFERAHALSHRPELLYNIGVAAERLRRDDRALEAFREYVRLVPNGVNRRQVDSRIAILEQALAERQRQATATLPVAEASPSPSAVTPAATANPPAESHSAIGWFIGAGAGAATLAFGVAYWVNRDHALEDCTQAISDGLVCGNEDALRRQRNAGIALTAIGGAALPTLLVIGILRARDRDDQGGDDDLVFVPVIDPISRTASLSLSGRF